ncbi:MAG: MFS transporter [Vicinamibacteria bacterium]
MKLPAIVQALGVREFRLLWTGAFVSSLGTWTQDVALSWLIQTQIGDPFYLGLRAFSAEVPLVAFMLVGGAMADRVDRRVILLSSQVLQMTFAASLGVLYYFGLLTVAPILVFAFLTGLAQSQSAPTYQAVLTTVVPPAQIPNAVALNSLQFNLSRMIGPAIAAVLLLRGGTLLCFVVNVLSFLAVILAIWRIRLPPPAAPAQKESFLDSLRAGFRHVKESPLLRTFTLLGAAASFFGFPLITYMPTIAAEVLRADVKGLSYLLSSFGAGAIVGAVTIAQRGQAKGRGRLLSLGFAAYGLATIGAVQSRSLPLSMALLFVAGLCLTTGFSTLNSLVQEHAPPALRGRVLSIFGFAFRGGLPFGALVSSLLVRDLGVPLVMSVFAGILALVALATLARSAPIRSL